MTNEEQKADELITDFQHLFPMVFTEQGKLMRELKLKSVALKVVKYLKYEATEERYEFWCKVEEILKK